MTLPAWMTADSGGAPASTTAPVNVAPAVLRSEVGLTDMSRSMSPGRHGSGGRKHRSRSR